MKTEQYQEFEWCPGAESNHRHEDFQSTALPLSYPGWVNVVRSGERCIMRSSRECPDPKQKKSVGF